MPAIAATLFGSTTPQLVQLAVTDLTGTEAVSVWAEPPSSPRRIVRGGYDVDPTSDALVLVDPMPELGRPIIYVVEYTLAGTRYQLSSSAITVPDPGRHVLSDPFTGAAVLVDVVAGDDERTTDQQGSVLYPVGASYGVAITDGREADVGTLPVYADAGSTAELVALLAPGSVIVSRHPNDGCDQPALEVLNISSASRRRRSRAGDRVWSLPYRVVAQPDPRQIVPTATLADLDAYYAPAGVLTDLWSDHGTLLGVALAEWVA